MTANTPRRCRRGHDWFPNLGPYEFIPTLDTCMRCSARRTVLPHGQCLGGHPIAEHYPSADGTPVPTSTCPGPR